MLARTSWLCDLLGGFFDIKSVLLKRRAHSSWLSFIASPGKRLPGGAVRRRRSAASGKHRRQLQPRHSLQPKGSRWRRGQVWQPSAPRPNESPTHALGMSRHQKRRGVRSLSPKRKWHGVRGPTLGVSRKRKWHGARVLLGCRSRTP